MLRRLTDLGSRTTLALLLAASLFATRANAQGLPPFDDPDERQERLEPPLSLPQGSVETVRPSRDPQPVKRVDTIQDMFRALQACWRPKGLRASGQEITVRFAFRRSGEIMGQPRITYYKPGGQEDDRENFTRSVREAFARCSHLPFTEKFGAAAAGRLFSFRFIDAVPI
jgi:hypothetical protein